MPQYTVVITHVDECEEERVLLRAIWDAEDAADAKKMAKELLPQIRADAEDNYGCDIDAEGISISCTSLKEYQLQLISTGDRWKETLARVRQYAFVKEGAEVIWNDPDDGACSGPKIVKRCVFYRDEDSTVLLVNPDGTGETEAYYSELDPYKET